jgi:type III secretion protein T
MQLHQVLSDIGRLMIALLCASVRIHAVFAMVPLFSRQAVPGLLRAGIGVGLSVVLVPPILASFASQIPTTIDLVLIVVKEAFIGMLLGYAVAALFWGVEAVGFFIDNQRGASIAATLNPLTGNDSSPLGILFNQAFTVYFLVAGGFGVFMSLVYASYGVWPVMHYIPALPSEGFAIFAGLFERVVRLGLLLSAPVIVAMLLCEMGLALVSRFAPQLQVFFLAMPIKSGMAFFVLVVYLPTFLGYLHDEIARLPGLLGLLGGALQ